MNRFTPWRSIFEKRNLQTLDYDHIGTYKIQSITVYYNSDQYIPNNMMIRVTLHCMRSTPNVDYFDKDVYYGWPVLDDSLYYMAGQYVAITIEELKQILSHDALKDVSMIPSAAMWPMHNKFQLVFEDKTITFSRSKESSDYLTSSND